MNWTAATAAFAVSAAAGFFEAEKRLRRGRTLFLLVLLLQRMELEIAFSRVPLPDMLSALLEEPPFRSFGFLAALVRVMTAGGSLQSAWKAAAETVQDLLQPWEQTHLLQLGSVLGTTGLDGQKMAMEETLAVLRPALERFRSQSKSGVTLCRVCGLCVGCVLFIMIL